MQKRYQVFVSSTYEDLKDERSKIITALLNIGHIPCGMEYFPAADEDAWGCIERLIPQCDYYVVLVAGKYGSIASGDTKSYTHKEYELAVKHKVPVLGLLHKDPSKLPSERCEGSPSIRKKLFLFRKIVERKLCRYWIAADQIPGELLASLTQQIDRFPRTGWARADEVASDEAKNEIIALRKDLDKATKALELLEKKESEEEKRLASGDDELPINVTIADYHDAFIFDEDAPKSGQEIDYRVVTTWNKLLRFVAVEKLERWTEDEFQSAIEREVEAISRRIAPIIKWQTVKVRIPKEEIRKIVIQLSALGMIARKEYRWALTPKGLVSSNRQLALRKGETEASTADWCMLRKTPKSRIRTVKLYPLKAMGWEL